MGLNGPQRATRVMSAPGGEGALRVLSRLGCAAGPRVSSALQAVPRAAALWRSSCRFGCSVHFSTAVAAIPAAPVPFCWWRHGGSACCKRLSAWRPPLKRSHPPARRRLGCGGSCRAKGRASLCSRLASHRSLPCSAPVMQRQTPVRQCAAERRSVACGLCRPHPHTWRRGPPCRRRRPAAPRHGLPETDLVESGMTGS